MKQAIVLIHGIGEQIPMDTLRGFVNAVWTTDAQARRPYVPATVWSKPDNVSRNFELRRLTTAENRDGKRTDFFEFYWAHLLEGTTLSQVGAWLEGLMLRWPGRVPQQLRGIWWALWLLTGVIAAGWCYHYAVAQPPGWFKWVWGLGHMAWAAVAWFLIYYAGDAARYLHVAPENVEKRRAIREAGLQLLQSLHDCGKYDRIVVVGHSLGTVIGYDIISHLWTRYNERFQIEPGSACHQTLRELEEAARQLEKHPDTLAAYQAAQTEFFIALRKSARPWLISDFVTLGSPLAHGTVLLARTPEEFRQKKDEREFPTCPPTFEEITVDGVKEKRFSYKPGADWLPHHAAAFAPTRWTNLYFPARWTIRGDVIGGPVQPALGNGVRDVMVHTDIWGGCLNHSDYWEFPHRRSDSPPEHIMALRAALALYEPVSGDTGETH